MSDFSIITPSFNMLEYLKRCSRSVTDQEGVTLEHIVIDGGSTDGTAQWLRDNVQIQSVREPDRGMYDAVNKGLDRAKGDILAYLNCDEQYLSGALHYVLSVFERFPDVDILFGDVLLIDPNGCLLAYRKGYTPRWQYILSSHMYLLSCAMFVRRRIVDEGIRFNPFLRDVGDADFVVRVLRRGFKARHALRYCSVFTMTGNNMSLSKNAQEEIMNLRVGAPWHVGALRPMLNLLRLTEKLLSGAYLQKYPLEYAVYTPDSSTKRVAFSATRGSPRWPQSAVGARRLA